MLRPGGVTREQLQQAVGQYGDGARGGIIRSRSGIDPRSAAERSERPRSPGVKYAHYAPSGEMLLVPAIWSGKLARVRQADRRRQKQGLPRRRVSPAPEHAQALRGADAVFDCGSAWRPGAGGQRLYAILRECDERD